MVNRNRGSIFRLPLITMMRRSVPPWNKSDLVAWLTKKFVHVPKSRFQVMGKKQLWAIYFKNQKIGHR